MAALLRPRLLGDCALFDCILLVRDEPPDDDLPVVCWRDELAVVDEDVVFV